MHYKKTVLEELPRLTNLDGERNPHGSIYIATVDDVGACAQQAAAHEPDFSFAPPEPWFKAHDFVLPNARVRPGAAHSVAIAATVLSRSDASCMAVSGTLSHVCQHTRKHLLFMRTRGGTPIRLAPCKKSADVG